MFGCDEDGLARNAVHVHACASLEIVEMHEVEFRDEEKVPCFFETCIANGRSFVTSGGKKTLTAFSWKSGSAALWSVPTTCSLAGGDRQKRIQ